MGCGEVRKEGLDLCDPGSQNRGPGHPLKVQDQPIRGLAVASAVRPASAATTAAAAATTASATVGTSASATTAVRTAATAVVAAAATPATPAGVRGTAAR